MRCDANFALYRIDQHTKKGQTKRSKVRIHVYLRNKRVLSFQLSSFHSPDLCAFAARPLCIIKKKKTNRSAGETGFPILNIDKTRETLLHSNASANSRVCMCSTPRLTSSPKTCKIYALLRHWKIRADIYCLPLVRSSHFFFLWMLMENFVNAGTLFTCYRTSPHCKIYN